jgi:simple sugar transport system permease protein
LKHYTLFKITDVSPLLAILVLHCAITLSFGWLQGWIIVKSGLASFIVTLGGLFLSSAV